jgi:hypothetical protein
MNYYVSAAHAHSVIDERVRDASYRRLAREAKRAARPEHTTTATAVAKPRRQFRLWTVVHFRQAHS